MKQFITILLCLVSVCIQAQVLPYQDTNLTPLERAKDIVSRMSLEEKVAQMQFDAPALPRLGIKKYNWWSEALHGVARAGTATVFPQAIGMAASWDADLLQDVFTAVSTEARAKNAEFARQGDVPIYQGLTFWTPNINIFRDPRWGRGQETYGEDPYLTSRLGVSVIHGLQGSEGHKYDKVHACAKHFAVHSGPEWSRHVFNAENIDPRDLWETYLPAFKSAVQEGGVKEVMCAYNRFEGEPCCGNARLLHQILRDDWGYEGLVVSDCWAVNDFFTEGSHHTEPDIPHAVAKAVLSGTDLECGGSYGSLVEATKQGLIDTAHIDQAIIRLMKARFELGEMDKDVDWTQIPYSVVSCPEHQALALKMAQEGIVLLQNNNDVLPLKKEQKIALIGPNANDSTMQWGNYNGFPAHTSTLLSALQQRYKNLIYETGCDHTSAMALESFIPLCVVDSQQGIKATYWNNLDYQGEVVATSHLTTPLNFTTAGATVFAPGVNLGYFTGRYQTSFVAPKSEDVVFNLHIMGHASLFINDQQVQWGVNMKVNRFYVLHAQEGQKYDIRLDFTASEGNCATLVFDFGREHPLDLDAICERVKDADVIVFAGGISPNLEGEEMPVQIPGFHGGDRDSINLPFVQRQLLQRLQTLGKPIVLVNYSGSAMDLKEETKSCSAIVQAWYPGQDGGEAVASILTGEYNPSGRLPITFYKGIEQLPDFEDYSMKGRTYRYLQQKPLFPFGYGLSYTHFNYGTTKISKAKMKAIDSVIVTVPVTNVGSCDGEEVVQLYVRRPDDGNGPQRTLRGFKRVKITKGQTINVQIPVSAKSLEWYDTTSHTLRPLAGSYEIQVGSSSDPTTLQTLPLVLKK